MKTINRKSNYITLNCVKIQSATTLKSKHSYTKDLGAKFGCKT